MSNHLSVTMALIIYIDMISPFPADNFEGFMTVFTVNGSQCHNKVYSSATLPR